MASPRPRARDDNGCGCHKGIGPLEVDVYEYPPPFLLLPRAARLLTRNFFAVRSVWFTFELGLLALAVLLTARWIGGRTGALSIWLAPSLGIAFPILLALQMGDFQIAVFALAVLSMLLIVRRKEAAGGALLGFITLAKLSPGVLGVYLLGQRRWAAMAWSFGFGTFFSLLALAAGGNLEIELAPEPGAWR